MIAGRNTPIIATDDLEINNDGFEFYRVRG